MKQLDKKLVLIGIRKKGERNFKIKTAIGKRGEHPKLLHSEQSFASSIAR